MSRPISKLSLNYQNNLMDYAAGQWDSFLQNIEDLQSKGITLESLAETIGISNRTIYRMKNNRTNGLFQKNFALISIISKLNGDYAKLPARRKRKKNRRSLKGAEIRVVRGS